MSALTRTAAVWWRPLAVALVPLGVLLAPAFGGLDAVQHRLLTIFVFAVLAWVLEPIPIYATSIVVIFTQLLLISDRVPPPLALPDGTETLPYESIIAGFADPIIILFLGGFFLAAAATKYRLDLNLARVILAPFGTRTPLVVLALMLITALFSMFMSNTATAAMMLAVAAPVIAAMPPEDRARRAVVLAIPLGANIGGIGTPIGTPPNAIAFSYLGPGNSLGIDPVSFGGWMLVAVPFVLVLLLVGWAVLGLRYRSEITTVRLSIDARWSRTPRAIVVYATFALTVALWVTGGWHGVPATVVAMLPIAVFLVTRVMGAPDLRALNWEVLWLVAGGVTLGNAMFATGLSEWFVGLIPFASMSAVAIVAAVAVVGLVMSTFISNTATAALLLPVVAALGASAPALGDPLPALLMTTVACSLAMALPVSTPPNSIAYSVGVAQTRDMVRVGVPVGVLGLLLAGAGVAFVAAM